MNRKIGTDKVQHWEVDGLKNSEKNQYLPLHKQEVRDERGRKRLHGAFTGGFSAGYFNTVGSKEGWAPSQFTSSRDQRADKSDARPEDFMDDEDLELNQKDIGLNDQYDNEANDKRENIKKLKLISEIEVAKASLTGTSHILDTKRLADVFLGAPTVSIGVIIMRKMGWRDGQGVGPRKKRNRKDIKDDIHAAELLFAPKDTRIAADRLTAKKDLFGVGYDPVKYAPEFSQNNNNRQSANGSTSFLGIKGGGFGEGIFDDDDDYDVYASNTIVYDVAEDGPKAITDGSQVKIDTRQGYDGRLALSNFKFAKDELRLFEISYDGLDVPSDFVPAPPIAYDTFASSNQLTPDTRRDLLGEEKLTGPALSICTYIDQKKKERETLLMGPAKVINQHPAESSVTNMEISKETALQALKGFIPFETDLAKQSRYVRYLSVKAGLETQMMQTPPHYTKVERSHEILEFLKAGQMFRPLSKFMASRFISQGTGVAKETVIEQAKFVRSSMKWNPARLLCKRFNIANPYPDLPDSGLNPNVKADPQERIDLLEMLNKSAMLDILQERDRIYHQPIKVKRPNNDAEENAEMLTMEVAPENVRVIDEEIFERPSMDIFNAIFADSDSEDESDDEPLPVANAIVKTLVKDESNSKTIFAVPEAVNLATKRTIPQTPTSFKPLFRKKGDRSVKKMTPKLIVDHAMSEHIATPLLAFDETLLEATPSKSYTPQAPPAGRMDDPSTTTDSILAITKKKRKKEKKRKNKMSFAVEEEWVELTSGSALADDQALIESKGKPRPQAEDYC